MRNVALPFPTPRALDAPPRGSVAVFAPHPDDEVIGVGGILALHRNVGDSVQVLVVTDGRAGNVAKRESQEIYVGRRRQESRAAAALLGGYELTFWDYPDSCEITNEAISEVSERAAEWLRQVRPDVVYTPWPGEGNGDHRAICQVTVRALAAAGFRGSCYGYEVYCPAPVDRIVNISAVAERKRAAIACFRSQLAETAIDHVIFGVNAARSLFLPKGARYGEGLMSIPLDLL